MDKITAQLLKEL